MMELQSILITQMEKEAFLAQHFFVVSDLKSFSSKAKTSRGDINSISKLIEFEKWTKGSAGKVLIVQASSTKLRQGVTKYNLHT